MARLRTLTVALAAALAGTSLRGEFEERLEGIIRGVRVPQDVTLFFDEAHALVGAGEER